MSTELLTCRLVDLISFHHQSCQGMIMIDKTIDGFSARKLYMYNCCMACLRSSVSLPVYKNSFKIKEIYRNGQQKKHRNKQQKLNAMMNHIAMKFAMHSKFPCTAT